MSEGGAYVGDEYGGEECDVECDDECEVECDDECGGLYVDVGLGFGLWHVPRRKQSGGESSRPRRSTAGAAAEHWKLVRVTMRPPPASTAASMATVASGHVWPAATARAVRAGLAGRGGVHRAGLLTDDGVQRAGGGGGGEGGDREELGEGGHAGVCCWAFPRRPARFIRAARRGGRH